MGFLLIYYAPRYLTISIEVEFNFKRLKHIEFVKKRG